MTKTGMFGPGWADRGREREREKAPAVGLPMNAQCPRHLHWSGFLLLFKNLLNVVELQPIAFAQEGADEAFTQGPSSSDPNPKSQAHLERPSLPSPVDSVLRHDPDLGLPDCRFETGVCLGRPGPWIGSSMPVPSGGVRPAERFERELEWRAAGASSASSAEVSDLKVWNYDGSSTGQADGHNSEARLGGVHPRTRAGRARGEVGEGG